VTAASILIADDDRAIRTVLTQALTRAGHDVRTTGSGKTLWQWVDRGDGDLVITDVVMPDANGLDIIPRIREERPGLKVIVMSAQNTLLTAVKATERGAFEYLAKPFDLTKLVETVQRALESGDEGEETKNPESAELPQGDGEKLPLIGRSPAMQEIYRVLARLMGTDLTVVIFGESGTGKELVARALHDYGKRKEGPFVALNMAAIPRELIESELFGHEKGAFTGALQRSAGRFEQARGGTLFLDEIGDMPLEAQTRLLRVLQEGEYTTVGGRQAIKADVRIIAATHRDLRQMVKAGQFREDLYYRLNVVPIRIPPLRERTEDIPELARHFFALGQREGLPAKSLDADAIAYIKNYSWPGNVRELENVIRRLGALYSQDVIDREIMEQELNEQSQGSEPSVPQDESLSQAVERHLKIYFQAHEGGLPASGLYDRVLHEIERPLIEICLGATKGNQIRAAQLLGLNRNTLRKKIRDLDIQFARGVKSGGKRYKSNLGRGSTGSSGARRRK
jgi:two-component system, NtrC family, nitrogen regulation response regulator GlnG